MAKQKSTSIQRVVDRPGEGTIVVARREQSVNVDGTTGLSVSVDMSTAPVPDRRYVADVASISRSNDSAKLIFGQKRVGIDELRSLVVIHMPAAAIHQFLGTVGDAQSSMEAYAKRCKILDAQLVNINEEPAQTVALAATIIVASFSGRDACMDFYYSSPYVAVQVIRGGGFAVEPVARVMLPMNMLLAICKKLDAIKGDLPNDSAEFLK